MTYADRLAASLAAAPIPPRRQTRSLAYTMSAPDPAAERLCYEAGFLAWAEATAAEWAAAYPDQRPFDVAAFDGCTYAPDTCRDCCFIHDLGCHYAATRAERRAADSALCSCIAAKSSYEGRLWAWLWPVRAAVFYASVSAYGFLTFRPPGPR